MKRSASIVLALLLGAVSGARAATFVLVDGGQVEGELVNVDQEPRISYVVRTPAGLQVTLLADRVKQVVTPKPEELEFEQIRHTYADTVDGQWQLSEWCREHGLVDARHGVLRHILELDPDHAKARALLGYRHVDGRWKTQREEMQDRGYVEYRGKWMLPQEIELREQEQLSAEKQREWFANLKLWRGWLDDAKKHDEAIAKLHAIHDPTALPAIKQLIDSDPLDAARLLMVDVVAGIDARAARELLVRVVLNDTAEEVRLTALDHLVRAPNPDTVGSFIQALKDKDNIKVNRAALALGRLKDPSAVGPLIDALVTNHRYRIVSSQPAGSTSAAFSPGGGGGFSTGSGPKEFIKAQMNPSALESLAAITGRADWGYDKALWKKWLATQRPSVGLDARRD